MNSSSPVLPTLSVICSIYNEAKAIPLFYQRISRVFEQLSSRYTPQLFFVDNGSEDGSLDVIRKLISNNDNLFVFVLSRNFGYQCAIDCAVKNTPGDLFVIIDVDCEDPPEMILDFVKHHESGYDIVYGERTDRPEGFLLRSSRKIFYRIIRRVADENFVLDMAEFSLFTSEVRDAIIQETNSFPFVRSSIGRIGFRRKNIPYRRESRIAGQTHYNLAGMIFFAIAGMLSASTFPLRAAAYVFPFWIAVLTGLMIAYSANYFWCMPLALLIGFGFCGLTIASASLYIARIYKNGLDRPNAIIRTRLSVLPPNCPRIHSK